MELDIALFLATSPIDPERHLDPTCVERYRKSVDHQAPVVVFRTEEGLVLVDGYHRVAAALREGRATIEADMRNGSRGDALAYAVAHGAAQRNLSPDEARMQIMKHSDPP